MSDLGTLVADPPLEQQAIMAKCCHPSGTFIEFSKEEEEEQSIVHRFEQIVHRYPERIAVKTKSRLLTYAELNATVNRLGQAILDQRGEKQEQIALLLEHDALMIAAILAVLKTSKIHVPLDPS